MAWHSKYETIFASVGDDCKLMMYVYMVGLSNEGMSLIYKFSYQDGMLETSRLIHQFTTFMRIMLVSTALVSVLTVNGSLPLVLAIR